MSSRMIPEILGACAIGFALAATGCVANAGDGQVIDDGPINNTNQPLWFGYSATSWTNGIVEVCFIPGDFTTAQRTAIRTAAENSWEKAAKVSFNGWADCPTLSAATTNLVVLAIKSDLSGVSGDSTVCTDGNASSCGGGGIGKAPSGDYNRIRFPDGAPAQRVVIHEFGHVLGFEHETDSPTLCTQRTGGAFSLQNEPDTDSIMTAFTSCNAATNLSSWDILGVRMAYGTHAPGSIVGTNGVCANIQGGVTTPGANIIGWTCQLQPWNSTWKRDNNSLLLKATTGSTSRCLNVNGGTPGSGFTQLISYDCSEGYTNEQFHFTGVEWRAMGKWCLQAEAATAGSPIRLEQCTGSPLQKWDFFETDRRIRLNGTSMCVNVPNGNTADGTQLVVWPCSTGTPFANELFDFSNSYIKYGGKAFNVSGGTIASGKPLVLYPPSPGTPYHNEQFSIAGHITVGSHCIDPQVSSPQDGTLIGVRACDANSASQVWEYFW